MGPPLPAELPKPPFTPRAAARIAFFFGPLAGAIVSAISLRRMRYPDKARKVTTVAFSMALVYALVLFFVPEILSRIVALAGEAVFYVTFQRIQEREFAEWQTANADIAPLNGWRAIGWGFAGLIVFIAVFFLVAFFLGLFGLEMR